MQVGRLAVGLLLLGCGACGLAFSPGDYAESSPDEAADAAPDADAAAPPDAGADPDAAGPGTRILLFAGRRAPVSGERASVGVAETMRTTLSAAGELGPWTFDVPPPQSRAWSRGLLSGDTLYLQGSTELALARLAGDRIDGAWRSSGARGLPESTMRPWLVSDTALAAAGGSIEGVFTTNVFVASILGDGSLAGWEVADAKLVKPRGDVTLLRGGDFLYALGGRDSTEADTVGRDEVEVARVEADGSLGAFAATTPLVDPGADAAPFGSFLPVVAAGAGYVFVLGGQPTTTSSSTSDVAIAAKVDAATGQLGPWIALPKLPAPMNGAAAVVAGGAVIVFGGNLGRSMSDGVLALSIATDGTFGAEWRKIGALPSPRAGLAAVVH